LALRGELSTSREPKKKEKEGGKRGKKENE